MSVITCDAMCRNKKRLPRVTATGLPACLALQCIAEQSNIGMVWLMFGFSSLSLSRPYSTDTYSLSSLLFNIL